MDDTTTLERTLRIINENGGDTAMLNVSNSMKQALAAWKKRKSN